MNKRIIFLCVGFLILGLLGGFFTFQLFSHKISTTYATDSPCSYEFLNPLRCDQETTINAKEYITLRNDLLSYIQKQQEHNGVKEVSLFFRDLVNGSTMNINSQESFSPASLLKVPLLITYYKKAEGDQSVLSRSFTIAGNIQSLPQDIKPQKSVVPGQNYSIDELLNLMITQSDNIAWEALLSDLRQNYSEDDLVITLSDLGIIDPRKVHTEQYITTQSYAAIFRILYNASYLSPGMSNQALKLLSQSSFHDGLVAGIPQGITVAHKFGEQKNDADNTQQLHDCGIIYYKPNPYLLCVMTQGDSIQNLEPIIATISQKIYDEVKQRN